MTDSDLSNLPNHCSNNNCKWCSERRERRRQRSIDAARGVVEPNHWDRKIGGVGDVFGYWPMVIPPLRSDPKVTYMKALHPGGPKHKKVRRWV